MADTNFKPLEKFTAILNNNKLKARVGVLGSHAARRGDSDMNNAEIGLVHEFGSPSQRIPQRSFLRMPVTNNLKKKLDASTILSKRLEEKCIAENSLRPYLELLGIVGVECVLEAFKTGGDGKWPPLSEKTLKYKMENGLVLDILIATQQLRNSISYDVK